nr:hypothetical protein [uncultured Roseateles sp.]
MQTTTTDSPVLPIAQLEQLRAIAPDRIDWVFEQTAKEADFRRSEIRRTNTLKFTSHIVTLLVALLAVAAVLGTTVYGMRIGQTAVAISLATATVVSLAAVFINANKQSDAKTRRKSGGASN